MGALLNSPSCSTTGRFYLVVDFIRALNLIKTRRNPTWLTASQEKAFEELKQLIRVPNTVNIFGATGVGKTFLAWIVADELDYIYFPHLDYLKQVEDLDRKKVILDNCQPSRHAHREALKMISFGNMSHAILITQQMIQDYTHYIELNLTLLDQIKVRENLAQVGLFYEVKEDSSLWNLVNPHL